MVEKAYNVLLVEDDLIDQMAFKRLVREGDLNFTYDIVSSVAEAFRFLEENTYDAIISDHDIGDGTAFDIMENNRDIPTILVTGAGDEEVAVRAMRQGAYDYLIKDPEHYYLKVLPITVQNAIRHHESDQKLRESEERFRELFEGTSDLIQSIDPEGNINYVNKAWKEALGYTDYEVGNLNFQDVIHPESLEHCLDIFGKVQNGDRVSEIEARFVTKEGKTLVVRGNATSSSESGVMLTKSIFHDVTDRIEAENLLKQVNLRLEEKVKERTKELAKINSNLIRQIEDRKRTEEELIVINDELNTFIYKTSHDIRGPLSSIMGLLDIAKMEDDSKNTGEYLEYIEDRIDHLDGILRELINVSKIRQGKIDAQKIDFEVVLEQVLTSIRHMPLYESITIETEINVGGDMVADPDILTTIFHNLTVNAIKYQNTEHNDSQFKITIDKWNDGITITAKDNGVGMNKTVQKMAFEMFYRGTESSDGSGLGLYIVQKGVAKLNGTIQLESTLGEGCLFRISLPNHADKLPNAPVMKKVAS